MKYEVKQEVKQEAGSVGSIDRRTSINKMPLCPPRPLREINNKRSSQLCLYLHLTNKTF